MTPSWLRASSSLVYVSLSLIFIAPVRAQTPALEFEREIGCAFCDGPELFGAVQGVSLSADGTIVVMDARAPMVRMFAVDGRSLGTLGREGDGPGELRLPLAAVQRADGGLVVVDLLQKRVTRFEPSGDVEGVASFNAFPAGAGFAEDAGRLVITATDFRGGLSLLALDVTTGGLDTVLARVPFLDGDGMRFIAPAVRRDGGFAFGAGEEEYRIAVYGPDAELEMQIERDVERRPRTREELDAASERRHVASGSRTEGSRPRAIEVDPRQPHFSNLTALRFDETGRLWVRTSRGPAGSTTFDLFDTRGRYLGETTVAREVGVYAVAGEWLTGLVSDETDIQRIAIWRLVERSGARS